MSIKSFGCDVLTCTFKVEAEGDCHADVGLEVWRVTGGCAPLRTEEPCLVHLAVSGLVAERTSWVSFYTVHPGRGSDQLFRDVSLRRSYRMNLLPSVNIVQFSHREGEWHILMKKSAEVYPWKIRLHIRNQNIDQLFR